MPDLQSRLNVCQPEVLKLNSQTQGGRGWTERSDRKPRNRAGLLCRLVSTAWLKFRGFARPLAPTTATHWHGVSTHCEPTPWRTLPASVTISVRHEKGVN